MHWVAKMLSELDKRSQQIPAEVNSFLLEGIFSFRHSNFGSTRQMLFRLMVKEYG